MFENKPQEFCHVGSLNLGELRQEAMLFEKSVLGKFLQGYSKRGRREF